MPLEAFDFSVDRTKTSFRATVTYRTKVYNQAAFAAQQRGTIVFVGNLTENGAQGNVNWEYIDQDAKRKIDFGKSFFDGQLSTTPQKDGRLCVTGEVYLRKAMANESKGVGRDIVYTGWKDYKKLYQQPIHKKPHFLRFYLTPTKQNGISTPIR